MNSSSESDLSPVLLYKREVTLSGHYIKRHFYINGIVFFIAVFILNARIVGNPTLGLFLIISIYRIAFSIDWGIKWTKKVEKPLIKSELFYLLGGLLIGPILLVFLLVGQFFIDLTPEIFQILLIVVGLFFLVSLILSGLEQFPINVVLGSSYLIFPPFFEDITMIGDYLYPFGLALLVSPLIYIIPPFIGYLIGKKAKFLMDHERTVYYIYFIAFLIAAMSVSFNTVIWTLLF